MIETEAVVLAMRTRHFHILKVDCLALVGVEQRILNKQLWKLVSVVQV